jgi:hypothetical protein
LSWESSCCNPCLSGFGDALAVENGYISIGVHFYRNDILMTGDDAIEGDYGYRNITWGDGGAAEPHRKTKRLPTVLPVNAECHDIAGTSSLRNATFTLVKESNPQQWGVPIKLEKSLKRIESGESNGWKSWAIIWQH